MNAILIELQRRFDAIRYDPRDFVFWVACYDYLHIVQHNEAIQSIMEEEERHYYEAEDIINAVLKVDRKAYGGPQPGPNDCAACWKFKPDKERLEKIERIHYAELLKLQSMNAHWLAFELYMVYLAVHEYTIKHELYTKYAHSDLADDHKLDWGWDLYLNGAMKYEKELDEIWRGNIAKKNILVNKGADVFRTIRLLHGRLSRLLVDKELDAMEAAHNSDSGVNRAQSHETGYDAESGCLAVSGFAVKIKRQDLRNYGCLILEHIFKHGLDATYSYRELTEDAFGEDYTSDKEKYWKRCHRACADINNKVEKASGGSVRSFLVFNTGIKGQVRIFQDYVKK